MSIPTLNWRETPLADRKTNQGWCENAFVNSRVLFQLYYDNVKKDMMLHDMVKKQYYHINGGKAKGYTIAFKLYKKVIEASDLPF
jgi:hypothetical protein